MKAYLLSIAGIVLITAAISMIAPGGKMGAFVKGVGKLFLLIVMLAPFYALIGEKNVAIFENSTKITLDNGYLTSCCELLSGRDSAEISQFLWENYGVTAEIAVIRDEKAGFQRESIQVKILDFGIIGQDEHTIKTEQIQRALVERYGCVAVVN